MGSWWFCARIDYGQVGQLPIVAGDDYILVPGEILVVRPWTDLDDNASDLGLYTNANFSSAASMVDFVQWGTGASIGRGNVAVSKGIWRQISAGVYDFVPRAGDGQSVAWRGINSGGDLLTPQHRLAERRAHPGTGQWHPRADEHTHSHSDTDCHAHGDTNRNTDQHQHQHTHSHAHRPVAGPADDLSATEHRPVSTDRLGRVQKW